MTKRAIPPAPKAQDAVTRGMLEALKENVESINGARGGKLSTLALNATLEDAVAKINEIIARIQE